MCGTYLTSLATHACMEYIKRIPYEWVLGFNVLFDVHAVSWQANTDVLRAERETVSAEQASAYVGRSLPLEC